MKHNNNIIAWVGTVITGICAGISTSEVTQIVLMIVGILSGIVSLSYNIYVWWVKAHADGKVTADELSELKDTIDKGTAKIDDATKTIDNKEKKE